ncbi:DUF3168 domain-containing protein [Sinorhizobium fredii]|uniref:DUF3168 domain-containing protein n=1 Tax=Rhizobium fredii TaxID=380 RepID=UPI0004ADBF81|nr:DUF3168 domain-containing protein [Sinorhizobium fredii]AWM24972.1 hypothetical protein AOX55_00001715 [Sinorhizobium fredii CCBAU 25509]
MDPAYELTAAVISRLKADATVASFVGSRVYNRPPDGTLTPPYISMGPSDALTNDADCIDGLEVTMQIDCWSWGSGEAFSDAQVRKLSGAVRAALHEAEMPLPTNALASLRHRITRYQRESDGTTNRAIISVTALLEVN